MLTYQTRILMAPDQDIILQEYASLMNTVEHSLFAIVAKGTSSASCKNAFLKKFNISARQFNACRVSLEGRIKACQVAQQLNIETLSIRIAKLGSQIERLEKQPSKYFLLHQKKRCRDRLQRRLSSIKDDYQRKCVRLCFGSKQLFNAQFHLEKNGFASHLEWKQAWQTARNSEFFTLGSKDETSGNQTCTARLQSDGKYCLRLRLPMALEEKYGKYLVIPDVVFAYGHDSILAALDSLEPRAISYRFKRDAKGWRIFASTTLKKVDSISEEGIGAIGIDLNADHVACVETDRFGNCIESKTFPLVSYGMSKGQLKATLGDLCKELIDWATATKKPIVIENLDFKKKKSALKEEGNKKFSRLLSSFAYSLFFQFLNARAYKGGIAVHRVNPAFTSVIGRVNFAQRYGLSIHLAAALCIARRHQKFSEEPCSPKGDIPDGKGGHVAFVLPVRNKQRHVWHFWGQVRKKLSTVLAAHFQAKNRSLSPPKRAPVTADSS